MEPIGTMHFAKHKINSNIHCYNDILHTTYENKNNKQRKNLLTEWLKCRLIDHIQLPIFFVLI